MEVGHLLGRLLNTEEHGNDTQRAPHCRSPGPVMRRCHHTGAKQPRQEPAPGGPPVWVLTRGVTAQQYLVESTKNGGLNETRKGSRCDHVHRPEGPAANTCGASGREQVLSHKASSQQIPHFTWPLPQKGQAWRCVCAWRAKGHSSGKHTEGILNSTGAVSSLRAFSEPSLQSRTSCSLTAKESAQHFPNSLEQRTLFYFPMARPSAS